MVFIKLIPQVFSQNTLLNLMAYLVMLFILLQRIKPVVFGLEPEMGPHAIILKPVNLKILAMKKV